MTAPAPSSSQTLARFAVVACSSCRQPWAVELRHATAKCPACAASVDVATRTKLWSGDDARTAADAAGQARAKLAGGNVPIAQPKPARHDSPEDAAAAKGQGIVNRSRRAEEVALWMTRLVGQPTHAQLLDAMQRAGLDRTRAEREIVRMLAMDYLTEPRAGSYRVLEP